MSLLVKFLSAYNRSGLRGGYRLTSLLARRIKSFHALPIETSAGFLYADLRIPAAHGLLADADNRSGEEVVMRRFVGAGDVVIDIGAHFGVFTLLLSSLVGKRGKVFAFEPNPELLPSLRRTIGTLGNVELFECALSNRNDTIDLFVPEDASMASLANWTKGSAGAVHTIRCEMNVLDEMLDVGDISQPTFIKCDVEGAELSVFHGARRILDRKDAPIVLFELNRRAAEAFGGSGAQYLQFFQSLVYPNYSFFEVRQNDMTKFASWEMDYANVLAVPASRMRN